VYKNSAAKRTPDIGLYNKHRKMWLKVRKTVKHMLRFCAECPSEKPSDIALIPQWISGINACSNQITEKAKNVFKDEFGVKCIGRNKNLMSVDFFNRVVEKNIEGPIRDGKDMMGFSLPDNTPEILMKVK
jgi:hypothetical protein